MDGGLLIGSAQALSGTGLSMGSAQATGAGPLMGSAQSMGSAWVTVNTGLLIGAAWATIRAVPVVVVMPSRISALRAMFVRILPFSCIVCSSCVWLMAAA